MDNGEATSYALNMVQERGRLMVEPGDDIYVGMIVGENARENDIPVNPVKEKRLTNMRSQGDGKGIQLIAAVEAERSNARWNTLTWTNTWKPRRRICVCAKRFWMPMPENVRRRPVPSKSWRNSGPACNFCFKPRAFLAKTSE